MGTEAMKLELIEWLAKLNDPSLVASLFDLKQAHASGDAQGMLTPQQRASIERGLADAAAGRTIPSEELWKGHGRTPKG